MKDLLEYIVKEIVNKPDEVKVTEVMEENGDTFLNIKVSPDDMGTIIGKEGRTIRAIRGLVRIKAIRENARVRVELEEVPGFEKKEIASEETKETTEPEKIEE